MLVKFYLRLKKMKTRNKVILFVVLLLLVVGFSNCKLLIYGMQQGIGQVKLVYNARPIADVMNDNTFPDSLKQKLLLIEKIKRFAIDSIGLKNSKNYTTFYDQHGKPIMWTVTASDRYKINSYLWCFPVVGCLPYKGFFDEAKVRKEAERLKNEGFDSKIGTVSAWSTLGYFKDPILSNMLNYDEGDLAELIIHELTHSTVFIKGKGQFNENLATLVGTEGAKYYLQSKYGKNSKEYNDYIGGNSDEDLFAKHLLRGAQQLDSLYATFTDNMTTATKDSIKQKAIEHVFETIDTISFYDKPAYHRFVMRKGKYNNAFFINYKTYHSEQNQFQKEFKETYRGDFKAYIAYLKRTYSSL